MHPYKESRMIRTESDIYVSRIGRTMWRLAKRRAASASALASAVFNLETLSATSSCQNSDKPLGQQPLEDADDEMAYPQTLSKFLQALTKELSEDDPDQDGP